MMVAELLVDGLYKQFGPAFYLRMLCVLLSYCFLMVVACLSLARTSN